ncbi:hypothetical protein [Legionella fallonii]|uniref:SdhB protein, substrate of the Dot/Icm system n=1 Tax=Legionella fallonii LLAP-10 TaxID=1212491 RepID=A0A098G526_9GAMM|nr:hypothetical protein [Legionella fallonii]CEG57066.1 SdhB protein, substrate of the Dot/Icm system [Legionella fallonii LLAP-10]
MPANDKSETPTSQLFTETRLYLLEVLKKQLDELLAEKLNSQKTGVPFVDFQNDPPQVGAIKKVINGIYYIEEALKNWENLGATNFAYTGPKALYQVYKALSLFDDANPNVREVVIQNYHIIQPLYSMAYDEIKKSGWMDKFIEMDNTEKVSDVVGKGISLLGSDLNKWNNTNPLISTFDKISQLMHGMATVQDKATTEQDKTKQMELIRSLLDDLDNNAFINQLSIADFEDAKAVKDLLNWFKNIQEDGFDFTKKSIEQYISWTNTYLPKLVVLADQLERQNYLKPGLLSKDLCSNANSLMKEMNQLLDSDSTYQITQRNATTDSLLPLRMQQIDAAQTKSVKVIMAAEQQKMAVAHFFKIMRAYQGKSFSEILESDRVLLRQVYPKVQMIIANADLSLENAFTEVLNTKGPETPNEKRGWWAAATGYAANFASYYGLIVANYGVSRLLAVEKVADNTIASQINSEKFKIMIAEKSREKIQLAQETVVSEEQTAKEKRPSLEARVVTRINEITQGLAGQVPEREIIPDKFTPVQAVDLTNLRGTLTYIQSLKLSTKVRESREALAILVTRHITKEESGSVSTLQVVINKSSEVHGQIKKVEDDLKQLEWWLEYFENSNFWWGLTTNVYTYTQLGSAASDLKQSIMALTPDAQKILAPVLQQITALSSGLSNKDQTPLDVSALERLKDEVIVLPKESAKKQQVQQSASVVEGAKIGEVAETRKTTPVTSPLIQESQPKSPPIDYIKKISEAREVLLAKYKSTLSEPLSLSLLEKQEKGVPFINIDNDAPQIAAIKKVINSMYYAEAAIKIWQQIDTSTTFGKAAAAHQGVAALSQLYKSMQLFTEVTPEVQNLIRENYDLIKPVIDSAETIIGDGQWAGQFKGMEWTKTIGSVIGQVVASVQSSPDDRTQTASLVSLLSELPTVMNNMANLAGADAEVSASSLRISQERIDAISNVLELLFEENSSLWNIFKGPQAILGLIELNKKFQSEATNLQEATIIAYQQWIKDRYPDLLVMLDEIETRYYLKAGTLSGPIILEVDKLNDKLNETIESKPPTSKLELIALSSDLASIRKMNLDIKKIDHWNESFQYENQETSAREFFATLRKYEDKLFSDITLEDIVILRQNFARIQLAMANNNLDIANECVTWLEQFATRPPKQQAGVKVSIAQILKQESTVQSYIAQRYKAAMLKIQVIDHAVNHIEFAAGESFKFSSEEPDVDALRQNYLLAQANKPQINPGELERITPSSLYNVRGNLAFLQELKMSSTVAEVREKFSQTTKDKFSRLIQDYLKKTEGQKEHIIREDEPTVVRQIKRVENGLYHLEEALKHFESINKSNRLVVQARALVEIQHQAAQLKDVLEKLTPELKEHYGPIAVKMLEFSKKVRSIDYNKKDLEDLGVVLQSTKQELLKRKTPRKVEAERVFFDSTPPQDDLANPNESAAAKARRLGVKYLHLASPTLEDSRKYLRARYPGEFGTQPAIIRNYTRRQLSDEQLMSEEINKLTDALRDHYGFNLTTIGVIVDVINQIQRVGSQTSEVVGMVNQLVTNDYVKIKENAYKDIITKLSQEEDYLCLKPGTLINPVMGVVNQLFLSAALELDMSFDKKLSVLDEKTFLNIVIAETEREINALKTEQDREPDNKERAFKIKVKEDKLEFLVGQLGLFADKDIDATKSALLDIQFDVYLRDQLKATSIKKPILDEYEKIVREHYRVNKNNFLAVSECANALYDSMQNFEKECISDYLIVYEAYRMLQKFGNKLPARNQDLKDYITVVNKELTDHSLSIGERVSKVQSLPNDKEFLDKLSAADDGTRFYISFIQFLVRIASSIIDSIVTGKNIVYVYNQKKIEDLMQNIEDTLKSQEVVTVENNVAEVIVTDKDERVSETLVAKKQIDSNEIDVELDDEKEPRSLGLNN